MPLSPDRQWPQLASLEELAEEIRIELAAALEPAPPAAPSWLPVELREEIDSWQKDGEALVAESRAVLVRAVALVPQPAFRASPAESMRLISEYRKRMEEAHAAAMREFQVQNEARFNALTHRRRAIREMLTAIAEKQTDPKTGKRPDARALLSRYAAAMEGFETFGRESTIYTNYRIAMIQPGLSPAQRRLLMGHALVGLAQPLPHGEVIPRGSERRPRPVW